MECFLWLQALEAKEMQDPGVNSYNHAIGVWKGLVPPRVELLAWFVMIGRINTKERRVGMNLLQGGGCHGPCQVWDQLGY